MASTGAVSTSAAIVTSRVISFQLEFVRPDGVTWGLLARTFDFVDQLLEKRLVRELFEQHYDDDVAYPNDVGIYSVESRMKGMYVGRLIVLYDVRDCAFFLSKRIADCACTVFCRSVWRRTAVPKRCALLLCQGRNDHLYARVFRPRRIEFTKLYGILDD